MISPGTLHPSDALRAVLGVLGALARLDGPRSERYTASAHSIGEAEVREWANALGVELPADVLVLAALRVPMLDDALGARTTDASDAAVDDDEWVVAWTADPFAMDPLSEDPSYQQVTDSYVCLARTASSGLDPDVLLVGPVSDDDAALPRRMTLSRFLSSRLAEHFERLGDSEDLPAKEIERIGAAWREASAHPMTDAEVAVAYAAELVGEVAAAAVRIRVTHAKLGPGTIVELREGDVAEVLLDSGERKRIKRSFLKEL